MKAIVRYDVSLGYKFSTYATWWIKNYIQRTINNNNSPIRLPMHVQNELSSFKRDISSLEQKRKTKLTDIEISKSLSIPIDVVRKYQQYLSYPLSLDASKSKEDGSSFKETIACEEDLEKTIEQNSLKEDIQVLFDCLDDREKAVIKMRFGLCEYYGRIKSMNEIAKSLSISVERVRRIEGIALIKMKRIVKTEDNAKSLVLYME